MEIITVREEDTQLSELLDRTVAGHDILLVRHGRPVARLVGCTTVPSPRVLGALAGRIRVADDFDAPLPESALAGFLS